MTLPSVFRSIRGRLALLIILAMVALVGYLVYDALQEREDERKQGRADLQRLAIVAATAQRTRFDATENFLNIVKQAESFVRIANEPDNEEAYEACNRGLFVSDQLVPGTRFTLWDRQGEVLCSSRGARPGDFSASDAIWFTQTVERNGFATGGYELLDDTDIPILSFGIPITDPATEVVVAYISGAVMVEGAELLPPGQELPGGGRLTVFDQTGTVISSTARSPGEVRTGFIDAFGGLTGYLDSGIASGNGRTGAGARVTDADDAMVGVVVSAETAEIVTPLAETLLRLTIPVAALTLLTLLAVWLLGQRWIVQPIEALGRASDALASGDLEARAQVASGVSEVDRLAAKFNEMAETRERASRAKDEFLGLVSHELKTPITTVLGNAEILRYREGRLDEESRRGAVQDVHENAVRLSAIVDNLLVLARLERGVGLESEPLSLMRLAESAAEEQMRRAPGHRVAVRGESVLGMGGETYVGQVLGNLIGNAIKYSPPDEAVEVVVEQRGDMAVVRVLDRGWGIDEAELEAVFEPFYRSERTATVAEGIGIGLSVCKRLVEAMGGEVWAAPRPDGGTEFGFSLVLVRDDEPSPASDEDPAVAPLNEPQTTVATSPG